MRILVANPNSTEAITEACAALARSAASSGTDIVPWTNRQGPPIIDSVYADYVAGHHLIRGLSKLHPVPDAIVLAGFGNYGTGAVKEMLDVPVISIAEAAMVLALPLCHRFGIVTTSPRMIAYTEDLVRLAGINERCAAVRAIGLPPITAPPPLATQVIAELAAVVGGIRAQLDIDLVILGGSRLSPYASALRQAVPITVLEPVECAVQFAEALVRLGLRQSKSGKFAPPPRPLSEYED